MPLSKARDRERKQKERSRIRLERLLCPPQTLNPVQPNAYYNMGLGLDFASLNKPELDADGNVIPEVT